MHLREGTPRLGAGYGGKGLSSGCSGQGFVLSPGAAGLSQRGRAESGAKGRYNASEKRTDNMDALKVLSVQRLAQYRPRGARPQVREGLLLSSSLAYLSPKAQAVLLDFISLLYSVT